MNTLSIERLKDFERDPLNNFLSRSEMMEVVKELIAIRELKGDQVPAAWRMWPEGDYGEGFIVNHEEDPAHKPGETDADGRHWVSSPLYDRPQKPVVLHDHANSDLVFSYKCPGCGSRPVIKHAGDCTHYHVETVEESEPAGGIVKEGE